MALSGMSSTSSRPVVLLGPQRENPGVAKAVADLGVTGGPLAVVTAGWEERESEDDELVEALAHSIGSGDTVVNLLLFPRADDVYNHHPALRDLMTERERRRKQLRDLYHLRLAPQLGVCRDLLSRLEVEALGDLSADRLLGPEIEHAIAGVRELDRHHLHRIVELEHEVGGRMSGHGDLVDHPVLVHHRRQVAELVGDAAALLIAGGHVGTLISLLRLFDVMNLATDKPVIAWSAGAMAIGQQVVLFHDSPARGAGDAEVFGPGFDLVPGIIPMPHARHRLALDDPRRVALMARRFDPLVCVGLDYTGRIDRLDGEYGSDVGSDLGWQGSGHTSVLQPNGAVISTGTEPLPEAPPVVGETAAVPSDPGPEQAALAAAARAGGGVLSAVLESWSLPVVGDGWALYVYRGRADAVRLHHWVSGLPSSQPFQRMPGTNLWTLVADLQRRARVEYKLEIVRGGHHELVRDPLNPVEARDPFGANSVVSGPDYRRPEWADEHPTARRGTVVDHQLHSSVFGQARPYSVYLPARFRPQRTYPLLIVHDGGDYLQYASLTTVLDNLIHRLEIP
ncbi:MAG: hypothetical protein OER95_16710, partial [Acidimicrobiia bacterium]|nr:hypothetical protein [Acidimicrobiia bacterium]